MAKKHMTEKFGYMSLNNDGIAIVFICLEGHWYYQLLVN